MAEIRVTPDTLTEAARRVSAIGERVHTLRHEAGRHAHAGAGTKAAAGISDLAAHWSAVLPHFADASDQLCRALHAAAAAYHAADADVGRAAADSHVGAGGAR